MPIVLAPILIGFLALLSAVIVLGLHQTINMWLRSLVDALQHPAGGIVGQIVSSPLALLASGVRYVVNQVDSKLSHFANASLPMVTGFLAGMAVLVKETYRAYTAVATDWTDALLHLRHRTMPREIAKKVTPVRAAAAAAGALAGKSISLERKDRRDFTRGIDRLKKEQGILAGLLLGVDLFVRGKHAREHHHAHTHDIPALEHGAARVGAEVGRLGKASARHESLLRKLAKLLTVAGFGALLWRVLVRWKLGWLRCSKVGRVGRFLCGMHTGLLDFLLGLGGAMFLFGDLCLLIDKLAGIAARVLPKLIAPLAVVGAALCNGQHAAALPLPLTTEPLPPRPQTPLALSGH